MSPLLPGQDLASHGNISTLPFSFPLFSDLDNTFAFFNSHAFERLPPWQRVQKCCACLLEHIQEIPPPSFLLPAVIGFIEHFNALNLSEQPLTLSLFEFWMNHFSKLSAQEQAQVRGKISGKYIPREEYGRLFPISLGKAYSGSHFVSAHLSPDLDTTVASFIGWLDAFAARVGTGQHLWNLPDGPAYSQIERLFTKLFGPAFFSILAHTEGSMRLTAMDLLTTDSILFADGSSTLTHLDHDMGNTAILYVDQEGYYQGDWRGSNFEPVEQITTLFDRVLRTFSHVIHVDLLKLFTEKLPPHDGIEKLYAERFSKSLQSVLDEVEEGSPYEPRLDLFCKKVLFLEKGLLSTFKELFTQLERVPISQVSLFLKELQNLPHLQIDSESASFQDQRTAIFRLLYQLVHTLDQAVDATLSYVDRLDVVMRIKHDILGYQPSSGTLRSDLDTLRLSIGERDYLAITWVDKQGRKTPLGIVLATTLRKDILGSVSQRDFSNFDEMRMAPYLTVISVIDHHKSAFQTRTPIQALLADAQSCNVLVAEQCFLINDRYGSCGVSLQQIDAQIKEYLSKDRLQVDHSLLQNLLRKQSILKRETTFYIHPLREYIEYFYCLHAILDDTDLLSKVGVRDVRCVAELLNRLKTLCSGVETEVITLENLIETPEEVKRAAEKLLKTPELHALYIALYKQREEEVEAALRSAANSSNLTLFADTKQQNGCCRIGQVKLFKGNQAFYKKHESKLLTVWLDESERIEKQDRDYDLHLMMLSTLESPSKQMIEGEDGLWIWAAPTSVALDHLTRFLSAFQHLALFQKNLPRVTVYGPKAREWQEIFMQNFRVAQSIQIEPQGSRTFAIIHYPCGLLNSRKTMISPFLPPFMGNEKTHFA